MRRTTQIERVIALLPTFCICLLLSSCAPDDIASPGYKYDYSILHNTVGKSREEAHALLGIKEDCISWFGTTLNGWDEVAKAPKLHEQSVSLSGVYKRQGTAIVTEANFSPAKGKTHK